MRQLLLLTVFGWSILFFNCASTNSAARHRILISLITSWHFEYSSRSDPNMAPAYRSQRVRNIIPLKSELQFPELLFAHVKKKLNVLVTKDALRAEGQIRLQAMAFADGGFKYLDVVLIDHRGLKLAETRVWNIDERNILKFDDSFAEFAADKITDLIESK